jgi:hypothetical protein
MIFDKDLSSFQKKYKTADLSGYDAVTLSNKKKLSHYIVAFTSDKGSVIAHEVVHLVNYIYQDCSMQLDRHNDEPQAYLTGWLFNKIEDFLKVKNK